MDGFSKIELSSTPPQNSQQEHESHHNKSGSSRMGKLKSRKLAAGLAILFALFLVFIIIPGLLFAISAQKTYAQLKVTMDAVKKQDIELASKELKNTRESLEDTQSKLNLLIALKFIPGPNIYYNDAQHMMKAAFHGMDAADTFVNSVEPYADVLGLKGQGSFVGGSAEQRIETAVKTMDKVTPKIDEIAEDVKLAESEIAKVDPNHYPSFMMGGKVKDGIVSVRETAAEGAKFIDEARPLIKVLPELLGQPEEKKYLLIFQNDKELRPTGGFITAYAVFKVNKGVISVEKSDDIYVLDNSVRNKDDAPEPILKYLPKVTEFNLRDSNLSPDFQDSMETFREIYDRAGQKVEVDGIIALDTNALVAAMNVLGDIEVNGKKYTTQIVPECDCPQVIYELSKEAGTRTQYIRADRKSSIGDLMLAIMNKAFQSSPGQYWGPLVQTAFGQIGQKHVLFSLDNKEAQKGLSAVNAAGEIKPFKGDYFHLNEANFGGSKSNLFVSQNVDMEYSVGDDGLITKTVTVNYKNPFKPSNCNLELENALCLNAPWRDWFRVYVPKGSKLVDSSGSEVKISTYEEFDKTVYEGFLTVRPLGVAKLKLTYTLPFKVKDGSPLPLMIQKQPGTDGDEYIIKVNGRQQDKFFLDSDKTLNVDL